MKLISLMDAAERRAGYVAKDGFNLVAAAMNGCRRFALTSADGAVWFADWQNFIIQHNPTPKRLCGGYDAGPTRRSARNLSGLRPRRIYRVVEKRGSRGRFAERRVHR